MRGGGGGGRVRALVARDAGQARRDPLRGGRRDGATPRRARRDRGARDGQVARARRCGETDGAIALGRFMAGEGQRHVRPHDHERHARPLRLDRAAADRRRGPHHRGKHADRQRRLEGVSRAGLRKRRGAQGRRGHAAHAWLFAPSRTRPGSRPGCTQRRARPRRRGRRAARGASRGGGHQLHRLDRRRAGGSPRPRARASRGCRSSSGGRTRSWSADDADLDAASSGPRCPRSATPASAARPAAASSSSTRSTTGSGTRWWPRPVGSKWAPPTRTTMDR